MLHILVGWGWRWQAEVTPALLTAVVDTEVGKRLHFYAGLQQQKNN